MLLYSPEVATSRPGRKKPGTFGPVALVTEVSPWTIFAEFLAATIKLCSPTECEGGRPGVTAAITSAQAITKLLFTTL